MIGTSESGVQLWVFPFLVRTTNRETDNYYITLFFQTCHLNIIPSLSNNVIFLRRAEFHKPRQLNVSSYAPQTTYNREIAKRTMFNANMCNKAI